jgi:hypothetical protein
VVRRPIRLLGNDVTPGGLLACGLQCAPLNSYRVVNTKGRR